MSIFSFNIVSRKIILEIIVPSFLSLSFSSFSAFVVRVFVPGLFEHSLVLTKRKSQHGLKGPVIKHSKRNRGWSRAHQKSGLQKSLDSFLFEHWTESFADALCSWSSTRPIFFASNCSAIRVASLVLGAHGSDMVSLRLCSSFIEVILKLSSVPIVFSDLEFLTDDIFWAKIWLV